MSFSREIKDFIAAFKSGYDLLPSQTDEDYKRARTRLENAQADYYEGKGGGALTAKEQAQIDNINNQIKNRDERTKIMRDRPASHAAQQDIEDQADEQAINDEYENSPPDEFARGGLVRNRRFTQGLPEQVMQRPMPMQAQVPSAIPAMPRPMAPGMAQPAMQAATMPGQMPGQMPMRPAVRGYAGGGTVEEQMGYAPYQPAIPSQATVKPAAVQPDMMAKPTEGPTPAGPGFSFLAADDAVEAGMNELVDRYGMRSDRAVATPEFKKKVKEFQDGGDETAIKQISELDPVVDPHKQLSPDQRLMKKLAVGYEYYLNKGDPKGAKKYAADLLMAAKGAFNRYKALSQVAEQNGDIDTSLMAALKAYSFVPDGKDLKLQKTPDGRYAFSYTDARTGQAITKGLKTPEEMLQIVTKHGMNTFEDLVMAASDMTKTEAAKPSQALLDTARGTGGPGPAAGATGGTPAAGPTPGEPNYAGAKNTSEVTAMERIDRSRRGKSRGMPVKVETATDFEGLESGTWFINPADGRVLQKK